MDFSHEPASPRTPADPVKIADWLEKHGWTRAVAGNEDFDAAVKALCEAKNRCLGLLICGEYGRGKTHLAEIVARSYNADFKVYLGLHNAWKLLTPEWQCRGMESPYNRSVFIDDLGVESRVNNYGEKIEPAADFLCEWHTRHAPGTRLVITTNMKAAELDARYGGRVVSRLKELCEGLVLNGEDHRIGHCVVAKKPGGWR